MKPSDMPISPAIKVGQRKKSSQVSPGARARLQTKPQIAAARGTDYSRRPKNIEAKAAPKAAPMNENTIEAMNSGAYTKLFTKIEMS